MDQKFSLHGLDLALSNSKPMMFSITYDYNIDKYNKYIYKRINTMINRPKTIYDKLLIIRKVDTNKFIYDSNIRGKDIIERGDYTDVYSVYERFEKDCIIKFYCSVTSPTMYIIWNHGLIDGIALYKILYNIFGQDYTSTGISYTSNSLLLAESLIRLPTLIHTSQIEQDLTRPLFDVITLSVATTKKLSKINNVSFVAQIVSTYLIILFSRFPEHVKSLRVNITCHITNENMFNNFSVVPITVYRNACAPTEINTQLNNNKCFIFAFQTIAKDTSKLDILKEMRFLDPDVNISLLKGNGKIGEQFNGKCIRAFSFASKAKIYCCGNQVNGDDYVMSNSITTSAYINSVY
jgi:hypothetical protein